MRLAVLMTCYNRVRTTLACLDVLLSQDCVRRGRVELDVYLVDDGSPDGTGVRVKQAYPFVHVIQGTGHLFWCKGMHLAWTSCVQSGLVHDAYLWLNDDVLLSEGALSQVLSDAEATGWGAAIVGAFLDGKGVMTYGVLENWAWIDPIGTPRETTGDISGNLVLVPKRVFDRVGFIADCYSHAYGDYDYAARLREAGVRYFLSSRICGRCDNEKPDYALESKSLLQRLKCLFKPNGHNWRDAIVYRWRHYGLLRALVTAIHVPYLVIKGKKRK